MLRLDHVVFPTSDPAASLAFYGETLGLPLIGAITGDDWGGRSWLMLAFGLAEGRELVLTAFRGGGPSAWGDLPPDARHYAFAVETAADQLAWRERLAKAGVAFWEEDHGDQQSIYFADPNGVVLEITTPPSAAPAHASPDALARARAWIEAERALTV